MHTCVGVFIHEKADVNTSALYIGKKTNIL